MIRVAFYGTLKRGKHWYCLIADQKFIKEDTIKGNLYIDDRSLPVLTQGNKDVPVEVFDVDERKLEQLTRFEEQAEYTTTRVKTASGEDVYCWFYNHDVKSAWKSIDEYK